MPKLNGSSIEQTGIIEEQNNYGSKATNIQ